ncbi:MAG: starch-binding protein [Prevotellaceae bacterium]|jgi:hypothetical protein|nr:starch-binding protein [Prevotellaceae bacterium]
MKNISTLILGLLCAVSVSAQNKLYFSPQTSNGGDWTEAGAKFNACLKSGDDAPVILYLAPVDGATNVYSADLASVEYDQIRFLRLAPTDPDVAGSDDWGWNKTGYMPFSYAEGNYWTMIQTIWNPGDNDKQFFTVSTYGQAVPTEDIVIKFKQPNNEWENVGIFAWGGTTANGIETFGGWPGTTPAKDADGWYSVTVAVAAGQTIGHVIFNDGKTHEQGEEVQFNADEVTTETACYELTASAATKVDCIISGIEDVFANPQKIERIEYYNLQGIRLNAEPQEGLFIAVPYYKGNIRGEAVKVINTRK